MAGELLGRCVAARPWQVSRRSDMAQGLGCGWLDGSELGVALVGWGAGHAPRLGERLAEGIAGMPGVKLWQPVESNAVFVPLDPGHIERLQRDVHFYVWDPSAHVVRWMTAFNTTEADIDAFRPMRKQLDRGLGEDRADGRTRVWGTGCPRPIGWERSGVVGGGRKGAAERSGG